MIKTRFNSMVYSNIMSPLEKILRGDILHVIKRIFSIACASQKGKYRKCFLYSLYKPADDFI